MGSDCEQRIDLSLKFADKKLLLRHRRQLCNKKHCDLVKTVSGALLYGDPLFA